MKQESEHDSFENKAVPPQEGTNTVFGSRPFLIFALAYILISIPNGMTGPAKHDIAKGLDVPLSDVLHLMAIPHFVYAITLLPASFLITRFNPGSLAWVAILLCTCGVSVRGLATDSLIFMMGGCLWAFGLSMSIPLLGQIARNQLSTATFIVGTTLVIVFAHAFQAISLLITEFALDWVGWRSLYIGSGIVLLVATVLVWRLVNLQDYEGQSVKKMLTGALEIIKSPILWIAAIASSLMLATFTDFGFVWDLTLQIDLGWNRTHAVVLSFLFLAGLITGGYFATLISKRVGTYKTVLTGISYSVALFAMALFVTPWQHQMWFVCPVLFTMGAGFGTCAMIVPYFTQFCRSESSGMYFAFTEVINASLIGTLVAIPLWVESAKGIWTEDMGRRAMYPYLGAFILGILFFLILGLLYRKTEKRLYGSG